MRKVIVAASLAAGLTMLAGCGDKPGAGNLTESDNRELNNASEMLDTSPDSLVANDEATLGNGEESADADNEAAMNEEADNGAVDPD